VKIVLLASVDSARRLLADQFSVPEGGELVTHCYATDASSNVAPGWRAFDQESFEHVFKKTSFAQWLANECRSSGLSLLILAVFCAEGLTVPHCVRLASEVLISIAGMSTVVWKPPDTWKHLFEHDAEITPLYG